MKGSYLAKIIDIEQQREKRLKELYSKKNNYIDDKCKRCANRKTELCHITEDIEGRMKCVNYKEEQNSIK